MHRGRQYIRAIQLYVRKFHKYPPNVDALVDTEGIRFLRKRYVDPITGKDDWQPIFFGQNKLPTAIGFFGMTKNGMPIAPIGSEVNGSPETAVSEEEQSAPSGISTNFGMNDAHSGSSSSDSQTFGDTVLIGVTIPSDKRSMLVYKRQQQYDMWEFAYDPTLDGVSMAHGGNSGANTSSSGSTSLPQTGPSGTPPNSQWGPNGNLPSPSQPPSGSAPTSPWGPNGNLPSSQ
jgi:hypothetical protein